jgi:adenylosuccinate lyase
MECVKAGMGREVAHQLIKKHSTSTTSGNFFEALAKEKEFPLSLDQLKNLITDPALFAGNALEQSESVRQRINKVTDSKIVKVELTQLR